MAKKKTPQIVMALYAHINYDPNPDIVIKVDLVNEVVWVTQRQIADVLQISIPAVNRSIQKIKQERGNKADQVIRNLLITAADGKTYEVEHYDMTILNLIGSRAHQTAATRAFQDWVGRILNKNVVDEAIERDPALAEAAAKRRAARGEGKIARNVFMQAIREALDPPQYVYGMATNDVYRGVFHRDHKELCRQLRTKAPRDQMDAVGLSYLRIAELVCARHIGDAEELTIAQAREIWTRVSQMIGFQVDTVEQQTGYDAVTGARLLGPIDAIRGAVNE